MRNGSVIVALCSAIVIMLAGCAKQPSDSGSSDESSNAVFDSAASGDSSDAASDSAGANVSSDVNSAPTESNGSSNGDSSSATDIGLEAAKAAALKHAGVAEADASFSEAKLEYDDGVAEYDIEFTANSKRYEYEIRAADGEVLEFSVNAIPDPTGLLSESEAKRIALEHAGFSEDRVTFTKFKLDYDDGISKYEIEFTVNGTEYEIDINAKTGDILKTEVDNDQR